MQKAARTVMVSVLQNSTNDNQIIPDQQIGMGYSSDTQMGTSTFCVDSSNITLHGKPISTIGFGSSMDFNSVQKDLGVDVSASISIDKFSGSLSAQYAKSVQDQGYSMSFSFVYQIALPTQILHVNKFANESLNDFGRGAFAEGKDRFTVMCGDKFIVQEASGAKLYATLNVKFNSHYDKTKFAVNFKGDITDLAGATVDIGRTAEKHSISGSIELSALQTGGNVMKLAGVFGTSPDNNILKCKLNPTDLPNCDKVVNDIINYAKQDFATQITYNNSGDEKISGVPTSLGYVYLEYDKIGIDALHFGVTPEVIAIRRFLGETDDQMLKTKAWLDVFVFSGETSGLMDYSKPKDNQTWVGKWVWQPELIEIAQKAQLSATYTHVERVLADIESPYLGAIQCYKYPNLCSEVNATISDSLQNNPISTRTLSFFNHSYSLSTKCGDTEFGFRYMFPIGYVQGAVKYFERSEFQIMDNGLLHNKTIVNFYALNITSDYAALSTISDDGTVNNCVRCPNVAPDDLVPVYQCQLSNCIADMCPIQAVIGQLTLFETESPI